MAEKTKFNFINFFLIFFQIPSNYIYIKGGLVCVYRNCLFSFVFSLHKQQFLYLDSDMERENKTGKKKEKTTGRAKKQNREQVKEREQVREVCW